MTKLQPPPVFVGQYVWVVTVGADGEDVMAFRRKIGAIHRESVVYDPNGDLVAKEAHGEEIGWVGKCLSDAEFAAWAEAKGWEAFTEFGELCNDYGIGITNGSIQSVEPVVEEVGDGNEGSDPGEESGGPGSEDGGGDAGDGEQVETSEKGGETQ